MNNQEAFEKMIAGLRGQDWNPSRGLINNVVSCVYRSPAGLKCVVGHLIPDKDYRTTFEGETSLGIQQYIPCLEDVSVAFLREMQLIHDEELTLLDADSSVDIVESLALVAYEYRLHFDPSWVLEPEDRLLPEIQVAMEVKEVEYAMS